MTKITISGNTEISIDCSKLNITGNIDAIKQEAVAKENSSEVIVDLKKLEKDGKKLIIIINDIEFFVHGYQWNTRFGDLIEGQLNFAR